MLKTTSLTGSSAILQSLIDTADKDEVGRVKNSGNKTNLSNPSPSKKSIGVGYLTFEGAKKGDKNPKRGGHNIVKGVEAAKGFNYLNLVAKKTFNHL